MFKRTAWRLVAAGEGPFDPYKILGVTPTASKAEIKRAYHRLALRFHPDSGPEGNAARFAAVHEAYDALKDGTWKPTPQQEQKAAGQGEPYGFDPTIRMYVYEKPGSTTESYLSGDTERWVRLFMIGCFLFVVVRFSLFFLYPKKKRPTPVVDAPDSATSGQAYGVDGLSQGASQFSVHAEGEKEWDWQTGLSGSGAGTASTTLVDPLTRRPSS